MTRFARAKAKRGRLNLLEEPLMPATERLQAGAAAAASTCRRQALLHLLQHRRRDAVPMQPPVHGHPRRIGEKPLFGNGNHVA